ncbi:MAG: nitroreductase family protein [Bacteroidales bacterium]|nr:nitroreductase family protein [Bacteroidales bacterium]
MKLRQLISLTAIALSATIILGGCMNSSSKQDKSEAVLKNIATRTSIRAFSDKPVDNETITKILKAGMAAPTAVNSQPWVFYVITDKGVMNKLAESSPNVKMAKSAAALIIPCGNKGKFLKGNAEGFWIQDLSAATQNILLAAHSLGLGAVWTGVYPDLKKVSTTSRIAGIKPSHIPLCVIPIGYPAENPNPKDKWNPEYVIYK